MRRAAAVKYGQEIAAAREQQGGSVVHCVEKEYRHLHQAAQDHHQHSERLVDFLKQSIKSQRNEEPEDAGEQLAHNAQAKERLVRHDIVCRRGRVPMHDQDCGYVEEAHDANH